MPKEKKPKTTKTGDDAATTPPLKRGVSPQPVAADFSPDFHFKEPSIQASFTHCTKTERDLLFPEYIRKCGLSDMILYALARLERVSQKVTDPWEWLRWRIFTGRYDLGDKEIFLKQVAELVGKRDKLLKERSDLLKAKQKREEAAAQVSTPTAN